MFQAITDYVASFGHELQATMKKASETYISPRRYILLANCVASCAAYYKHAQNIGMLSTKDSVFVDGAEIAVMYVFSTALGIDPTIVTTCHNKVKNILKNIIGNESDKLRYDINSAGSADAKIRLLKTNMGMISKWTPSEITNLFQVVTYSVVESLRSGWEDTGKGNKRSADEVVAAASAVDGLRSFFEDQKSNSPSTTVRVVTENVHGNLTCNIISFMNDVAQAQMALGDKKQAAICTYDRVKNSQAVSPAFRELWNGKLINNSVKDTVQTVLNSK